MSRNRFSAAVCHGAVAGAMLALSTAPAAAQPASPPTAQQLAAAMLEAHNQARARVGSVPLVWDAALAGQARAWAQQQARDGRMRHSAANSRRGQGENLWSGTRGAYTPAEMAKAWIDERQYFVNRPAVAFSTTGNWFDVGHYTQIIWSATTRVGCGLASDRRNDHLVCRYSPSGNIIGQTAIPVR